VHLRETIPRCLARLAPKEGNGNDDQGPAREDQWRLRGIVVYPRLEHVRPPTSSYNSADAYVMPSYGEGFGIVFLEALACGVPVIGSKVDGSREALLDGQLGRPVDPNVREELVERTRSFR
jgi:hypothetical protein